MVASGSARTGAPPVHVTNYRVFTPGWWAGAAQRAGGAARKGPQLRNQKIQKAFVDFLSDNMSGRLLAYQLNTPLAQLRLRPPTAVMKYSRRAAHIHDVMVLFLHMTRGTLALDPTC